MKTEDLSNIVFLMLIAGRKQKDAILASMLEKGAHLTNIMYGKGTVEASYLESMLGLVPEENKVVITCLLPEEKTNAVFAMLVEKFNFHKPNTGIAFTIPIKRLSF